MSREGEKPVDSDIVSEDTYSGGGRERGYAVVPHARPAHRATDRLSRPASLLAVLLLSLGLWAAIWAAVGYLARVLLG